jgi:ferric-dicitrate binding protein FerR (iron transport regulator)
MSGWGERYSGLWAMLVGLALLAGGYWFWSALRRNPPLAVVAARPGRMQSFWLPDSSFFLLQGESQILYPVRGFGTRLRQIALQGQAYVEVRSGKIPLRIRCDSLYVDVSGPAVGNIRWRYGRLELTVVSGRPMATSGSSRTGSALSGPSPPTLRPDRLSPISSGVSDGCTSFRPRSTRCSMNCAAAGICVWRPTPACSIDP